LETNNDITERKGAERQQEALYQLAQRESAAASLQEIYEAALDTILSAVGCDRASILLFDEKQVMRFVAWRGLSKRYRKAVEGHSTCQPDTKNPETGCISDVDHHKIAEHVKSLIKTAY